VLGELGHAFTAVEFLDGSDDCFTLRLCLGESNSVCKVDIGNINSGLHDSILSIGIFHVNDEGNTGLAGFFARRIGDQHEEPWLASARAVQKPWPSIPNSGKLLR